MQTAQIFTDEWLFQLVVVMIYLAGFCFALCAMEIAVCVYAEIRGEVTDLPTQKDIHRMILWFRRNKIRNQRQQRRVSNIYQSFNPNCHEQKHYSLKGDQGNDGRIFADDMAGAKRSC